MKHKNKYIELKRPKKDQIDIILKNELNSKDLKRLLNLVRGTNVGSVLGLIEAKKTLARTDIELNLTPWRKSMDHIIKIFPIIFDLYKKAGLEEKDWYIHWEVTRHDQQQLHINANTNSKPPRQDNKTSINYGSGYSNGNTIRYPRKNRKTAWKRFYKLFPHLKPETQK